MPIGFWSFLNSRKRIIYFFLIVGFLVYLSAIPNQLFWDDQDGILRNAYIKDWQYFGKYFSENLIAGSGLQSNYWRPILLIIYSLEWHLWGDWAPGYHIVSILTHIASAIALFYLLKRILKEKNIALFSALFFLVHPVQTEAVAYVSGLADPLSSLFIFLALISFNRAKTNQGLHFYGSLVFFGLSLMTKEKSALIFPSLLGLIIFLQLLKNKSQSRWRRLLSYWPKLWPLALMGLLYVILRVTSLNFQNTFNLYAEQNPYTESILVRLATFLKILPQYLALIFWPHDLHMERQVPFQTTFKDFSVFLGALLPISSIGLLIWGIVKKNRPVIFFIGWFWATLFPASGILAPMSGLMYEHYLYLPLIGVLGGVTAFGLWLLEQKNNPLLTKIAFCLLMIYFVFLSANTFLRNKIWRDPITFYNNVIQYNQSSLRVWNNLGMAYADNKNWEQALWAYGKAVELDSTNQSSAPHHNLANIFTELGKKEEAIAEYRQALSIDPGFSFSYGGLLALYLEKEDFNSALTMLKKALEQFPNDPEIKSMIRQLEEKTKQNKKE